MGGRGACAGGQAPRIVEKAAMLLVELPEVAMLPHRRTELLPTSKLRRLDRLQHTRCMLSLGVTILLLSGPWNRQCSSSACFW